MSVELLTSKNSASTGTGKIEVYLVGGAVRDQLLGIASHDRDWVVVGATQTDMLAAGFQQVGQEFPVFLHPQSKEEYALARTERKTGVGYQGFSFDATAKVSLIDDLKRRDLTINAIAQASSGEIIDPYHGQADIQARQLRHVSSAFTEDPLRVLRVARFHARYQPLGFTIAPDTLQLMTELSQAGELAHLTPERVWLETQKALSEPMPATYFADLVEVKALPVLFPELACIELTTPFQELQACVALTQTSSTFAPNTSIRFAVLLKNIGFNLAPAERKQQVIAMCKRLKVSSFDTKLAVLVNQYFSVYTQCFSQSASQLLEVLLQLDLFRQPEWLEPWLLACQACATSGNTNTDTSGFFRYIHRAAAKIQYQAVNPNLKGAAITAAFKDLRLAAVEQAILEFKHTC